MRLRNAALVAGLSLGMYQKVFVEPNALALRNTDELAYAAAPAVASKRGRLFDSARMSERRHCEKRGALIGESVRTQVWALHPLCCADLDSFQNNVDADLLVGYPLESVQAA